MAMPEGNATVCFYAEQVSADDDIEYRTRVLVFNLPSGDGDAELWAFITSTRVLGDAPIGMQDASFREALAILANMRFE